MLLWPWTPYTRFLQIWVLSLALDISNSNAFFIAFQGEQQLDCALDLMRRLPPQQIEKNLGELIDLVPELCEDLLSSVDQPLKIAKDKQTGKDYLLCDYNRDGDSYRWGAWFARIIRRTFIGDSSSAIKIIDERSPYGLPANDGRSRIWTTRKFEETSWIFEQPQGFSKVISVARCLRIN